MLLESTLAVLIGLTQANVNQDENGVASNAADQATLQVPGALKQMVDNVKLQLGLLSLRFEIWRLERIGQQQEEQFRKFQEDFYRRQKQIDFPKVPEIVPDRLPPGQRRV
jgi:hypothetical protein